MLTVIVFDALGWNGGARWAGLEVVVMEYKLGVPVLLKVGREGGKKIKTRERRLFFFLARPA